MPYKRLMPSDRTQVLVIPPEEVGARILSHLKRHSERSLPFFRRNMGFTFGSLTVVGARRVHEGATRGDVESREQSRGSPPPGCWRNQSPPPSLMGYTRTTGNVRWLVYDLGGGTLDVAVLRLERSSRTFLVLGTAGDPHLGGEDFDRALVGWLRTRLESAGYHLPSDDSARWEEGGAACHGAREAIVIGGGARRGEGRAATRIPPRTATKSRLFPCTSCGRCWMTTDLDARTRRGSRAPLCGSRAMISRRLVPIWWTGR